VTHIDHLIAHWTLFLSTLTNSQWTVRCLLIHFKSVSSPQLWNMVAHLTFWIYLLNKQEAIGMPSFASGLNANLLNCQLLTYLIPKRIESPWTSRLGVNYCIDQLSQILAIVKFTFCVWILVCFLQEPVSNRHRWFKTQAHEKRDRILFWWWLYTYPPLLAPARNWSRS